MLSLFLSFLLSKMSDAGGLELREREEGGRERREGGREGGREREEES